MTRAALLIAAVAGVASPAAAQFVVEAAPPPKPPVVDGHVGDDEWDGAALAAGFVRFEPQRGTPSPFRTEARVFADASHLYVAFRAWDSEPLTAQLTQRDAALDRDDAVAVVIDTFADQQTAYYFAVNPLGTQADGRIADDGRTVDGTWDAPWQSATMRTDWGWSAEIAVPFTSIRYVAGTDRTWGINFSRSRRRSLELSHWAGPLDQPYRVSQAGRLTGLSLEPPARRQQIVPYGLTRLQQSESSDWDAGVDARYAVTPQMAVYGTLFPDFATVEADQETINLTRFEVQLPEKRQFFLEGNELFGQRIRTFYSRRIAEIAGGGKVLGRQGAWTVDGLSAVSEPLGDGVDRANYSVGRVQRTVSGRSNMGGMVANRRYRGVDEGSAGVDTTVFLGKTFNVTGQFVKSWGTFDTGTTAFYVRPSYDSPTGHAHIRYTHLGDHVGDNVNPIGQIRDDDRRELDGAIEKTQWLTGTAVERVEYESNYNIYWSQTGVLRSWQVDQGLSVDWRNRFSTSVDYTEEYALFEDDFRNRQVGVELGYNTREYQSVQVGYEFGRNFGSDYALWTGSLKRKLTTQLSIEYELQRLTLTPDPDRDSTWIHVLRGSQFFTKDLFLRVFYQVNSVIERHNVQATFVYRYLPPFGTIQVVYQRGTAEFGQRSNQGHTLFMKATTVF
ncbi:MAG: carbohydrate binding family 9 domain-containing protein [Vicinamibacteria bacterium]|nr:carbohydrate binding family 9 domain-containing protein [Vicinamibacteria bacterium]